jgi:2'-phosphotransferase
MGKKDPSSKVSRFLTAILRHRAVEMGIPIRSDGYIRVRDLRDKVDFHLSLEELAELVRLDKKTRFSLIQEGEEWLIRANQGHSLKEVISEDLLTLISEEDVNKFPIAVHGTTLLAWESIQKMGLSKMERNHIHFAISDDLTQTLSGFRVKSEVLVYIDVKKCMHAGMTFWISKNHVILSSGIDGVIIPEFFSRVTDRTGKSLL